MTTRIRPIGVPTWYNGSGAEVTISEGRARASGFYNWAVDGRVLAGHNGLRVQISEVSVRFNGGRGSVAFDIDVIEGAVPYDEYGSATVYLCPLRS